MWGFRITEVLYLVFSCVLSTTTTNIQRSTHQFSQRPSPLMLLSLVSKTITKAISIRLLPSSVIGLRVNWVPIHVLVLTILSHLTPKPSNPRDFKGEIRLTVTIEHLLPRMIVCILEITGLLCLTFSFDSAVNCMYWEQRFPRLLTSKELLDLRSMGQSRLSVIADITCDKGGSIEFLKKYSSIQNPFFRFVNWLTLQHVDK